MSIAAVATNADDNDPYQQQQQLLKSLNLSLQWNYFVLIIVFHDIRSVAAVATTAVYDD